MFYSRAVNYSLAHANFYEKKRKQTRNTQNNKNQGKTQKT